MVECAGCGKAIGDGGGEQRAASISGGVMGDEYTDSYFLCGGCGAYTVEVHRDRFLGEEESSTRGPLSRAEGDARVELIGRCPRPWDKRCRCGAHRAYFGGWLD